jgi:hypothetical protein
MKFGPMFFFLFIFVIVFNLSCKKEDHSIDRNIFRFNRMDTLIFKSINQNDTFIIRNIEDYWTEIDGINIENIHITFQQLNSDCYPACRGYEIYMSYDGIALAFRNIVRSVSWHSYGQYTLGNHKLHNVSLIRNMTSINTEDVKNIYYHFNYGVIAYELMSGELFELDEKYIGK